LSYILEDLLGQMPERKASDLHLRVGEPPIMRIHGELERLDYPVLEHDSTTELMYAIMNEGQIARLKERLVLDMAHEIKGVGRYRVNCFFQQGHLSAVMRLIPWEITGVDELGLPVILKDFALAPRGLFLVTGPTGSGKSTTLAAMIDHINVNRHAHIVTIEDPIEFVHQDKSCAIEQREVGQDTLGFADALRHVMRASPDVILVGEMRDLETMSLAITAAETGHLVFATVHTTDAMQTVDRIVDVFPPSQQQQIRMQLSVALIGVVSQGLLPTKHYAGRVPAFEIMRCTPAIRAVIREGKTHMIYNMIQGGRDDGMIVLDAHLAELVKLDIVDYEQAISKSSYPKEFARRCGHTTSSADG
jgi:twitching motility protein PilT